MAKKKFMMQLNALLVKKEYQHDDIKPDVNIKDKVSIAGVKSVERNVTNRN